MEARKGQDAGENCLKAWFTTAVLGEARTQILHLGEGRPDADPHQRKGRIICNLAHPGTNPHVIQELIISERPDPLSGFTGYVDRVR
jgi:hypothetical protein